MEKCEAEATDFSHLSEPKLPRGQIHLLARALHSLESASELRFHLPSPFLPTCPNAEAAMARYPLPDSESHRSDAQFGAPLIWCSDRSQTLGVVGSHAAHHQGARDRFSRGQVLRHSGERSRSRISPPPQSARDDY